MSVGENHNTTPPALRWSEEVCAKSKRSDSHHAWHFDGDDPYIVCAWCGVRRDALTGAAVPPAVWGRE